MKGIKSDLLINLKDGYGVTMEELFYYQESPLKVYVVPKGYKTDFASIPSVFQPVFEKLGRHNNAAILHDYLYDHGYSKYKLTRKEADKIFLDEMQILGVSKIKRKSMYYAVRMFGGSRFIK